MSDKKKFYINGKWVSPKSNKSIQVINPATEEVCAEISCLLYTSDAADDP